MLQKREKIKCLYEDFKRRFSGKTNGQLYSSVKHEFNIYRLSIDSRKEKLYLKKFAKEFFQFKNCVIFTKNDLMRFKSSEQYKQDTLLNKIRFKKELKKYNKLCGQFCEFEEFFYQQMGFSLFDVENARQVEEEKLEKQSGIKYIN